MSNVIGDKDLRNMVTPLRSSSHLTQGVIFTCAQAEGYAGCDVHGLIITARCDTEHDKAPVFNYIPIVRFPDWLSRDFLRITCARDSAQIQSNLASTLKSLSLSTSILSTQSPRSILDKLFNSTEKPVATAKKRFTQLVEQWEIIQSIQLPFNGLAQLSKHFRKTHEAVIRECVTQRLAGFYFLDTIFPDNSESVGYVALLREVHHIPARLAHRIAEGMDSLEYNKFCELQPLSLGKLDFTTNDFAMPIGVLRSPEIEHLMQTFAMLFIRIGVQDPQSSYIDSLCSQHLGQEQRR